MPSLLSSALLLAAALPLVGLLMVVFVSTGGFALLGLLGALAAFCFVPAPWDWPVACGSLATNLALGLFMCCQPSGRRDPSVTV